MNSFISIQSQDGFSLSAYQALPEGTPKGAIMVIQEIFGVNQHIQEVADSYAKKGYAVLAPAIFDRIRPNIELGYEEPDTAEGFGYAFEQLDHARTLEDLAATVENLKQYGKVGVVGYCFGGLMAFLSTLHIASLDCAVAYYGGGIANNLQTLPKVPVMFHFGDRDEFIPPEQVEAIKAAMPKAPAFIYEANHGFNCDHRAAYDGASAEQARARTLDFFASHIG